MVICLKCSYFQILIFRFVIMYQFFFVVGYLDLDGCVSFDFIFQDCVFKFGCFSCNKEMKVKVCILINKSYYLNFVKKQCISNIFVIFYFLKGEKFK